MKDSIERIYADVPDVKCKGLCASACGPILMSRAEQRNMAENAGGPAEASLNHRCSKLEGTRCSVYEHRPLICRIYGTTRRLSCPYGCSPEAGFIPERKVRRLLERADVLP